jgi:hypothetical protein
MSSHLQSAAAPDAKPPKLSLAAPRVRVVQEGDGRAIELASDETEDLDDFRTRFLAAFGTTDETIAEALFRQLLNVFHTEPGQPLDSSTANLALTLMHSIGPKDEIEAMLACQMVTAHIAAMDASRRALHTEQTPSGRQAYLSLARKLMGLFVSQLDAHNRARGKAIVQRVVVERVNVGSGGKAVVGAVANGGRGDDGKFGRSIP